MTKGVLDGVRVIDMAETLAGSVAALVLAEAGADVVKIEPRAGARLREKPAFAVWNRSKRSIALDANGADRATFEALVRAGDVLIHDLGPKDAAARGLDDARLNALAPDLIVAAITGFPRGHDEEDMPAIDTLVLAAAGMMDEQAPVARKGGPIYLRFPLGSWGAAWLAAIGVAARVFNQRRGAEAGGLGVSLLQGALVPMLMHWRRIENPSPVLGRGMPKLETNATLVECADGVWLHIMSGPLEQTPLMSKALAAMSAEQRATANAHSTTARPNWGAMKVAFKTKPSAEWLEALWANDVAVQPALPMGALYFDEQCQANGYVLNIDDPQFGATRQPGMPFTVNPPARVQGPAPRLDGDRAAILAAWTARAPRRATAKFKRPLEGVKVVDFGNYLAGPLAPMMMGDLGAEVIKLEATTGDAMRGGEWAFFGCQRNKRSIAVDMRNPASRDIVERLVREADVVHHNLRMPAASKLGIDYESLRAINPRLVYCHVSAYGPAGPRKDWPGYDQLFQASAGWEYEGAGAGNAPMWHRFGMMDHQAALASLYATMLALVERERTGEGQFVAASLLGASLLTTSETLVLPSGDLAPYPKLDKLQMGVGPGDRLYQAADGWMALVADEAALAALCAALGVPGPEGLETRLAGITVSDALDCARAAGALAAPARLDQARAFFDNDANQHIRLAASTQHPAYGKVEQPSALWRFDGQELAFERAPPQLGQHTEEILAELGFSAAEIAGLFGKRVIVQAGRMAEPAVEAAR